MKKMAKVCVGALTIMLIGTTALFLKVRVAEDSECVEYKYNTPGFNEKGKKLDLEFYSFRERALKTGAYFSVVYNKDNGVISYNEVKKEEIPAKAMEGLKQYVD